MNGFNKFLNSPSCVQILPFNHDRGNPASRFRGFNVHDVLNELGHKTLLVKRENIDHKRSIVYGDYSIGGIEYGVNIQSFIKSNGKSFIFDFADDVDVNIENAINNSNRKERKRLRGMKPKFFDFLHRCDYVAVSSLGLYKKYSKSHRNLVYLPDIVDFELFRNEVDFNQYKKNNLKSLLWVGYKDNLPVLEIIRKPLEMLARKFPRTFEVVVITSKERSSTYKGTISNEKLLKQYRFPSRFVEWSKEGYVQELDRAYAALAPVKRGACKSINKLITYSARGIPALASSTIDYEEGLNGTGNNIGILCDTEQDWFEALDSIISDEPTRNELAWQARQMALELHNPITIGKKWAEALLRNC